MFQAKNDKETIASWRLDLNRILHVFNVSSVTSVWPLLTICFQTELSINTNIAVSDVHRDVTNAQTIVSNTQIVVSDTHVIVSELQRDVTSTRTIVSDIHRTMRENQEGTDSKHLLVSFTLIFSPENQYSPFPRLGLG